MRRVHVFLYYHVMCELSLMLMGSVILIKWAVQAHTSYRKKMADDEQIEMISDQDFPDHQQLRNDGASIFDGVYDIVKLSKEYVVAKCTFENESCLLIHHENLYSHPGQGKTGREGEREREPGTGKTGIGKPRPLRRNIAPIC